MPSGEARFGGFANDRRVALDHVSPLFLDPDQRFELVGLPIQPSTGSLNGLHWLTLPEWAAHLAPDGTPGFYLPQFNGPTSWFEYDWWRCIAFFVELQNEAYVERRRGPIHSYASRLGAQTAKAFDYAWVNRIVEFLKLWYSRGLGLSSVEFFGEMPSARITLTHDVDAVDKTLRVRLKQAIFQLLSGNFMAMLEVLIGYRDYALHDAVLDMEKKHGWSSIWCVFAGTQRHWWTPAAKIFDPAYSLENPKVRKLLSSVIAANGIVGLHASFSSWKRPRLMMAERKNLASVLSGELAYVRQHWLNLSLRDTWSIQRDSGLTTDFSLGFNDRVGFRASTALPLFPLADGFRVVPTVIMDSNLYGPEFRNDADREKKVDRILDELEMFGGHVAVNWHPHTFSKDFGWGDSYQYLLASIASRRIEVSF